jgi:ABC-type phosphate transport system substrate-binding protein
MAARNLLKAVALLGLVVASSLSSSPVASAGGQLSVIVNAKTSVEALNAAGVKSHFLREHKEWSDGTKVRPARQEGDMHAAFLSKVLGMSSIEYERYWLERKYSAAEAPPKSVEDDEAAIKFVGAMTGSIGYVDAASLDDKAKAKVKVVLTVAY